MKATGIVRKVDELGRVVIPIELRRTMKINEGDPMEIFVVDGDQIILKKYVNEEQCAVCHGYRDDLITLDSAKICRSCAQSAVAALR